MTLCAAYAHPIEEKVIAEYKADQKRKYEQKINRTNALAMTQEIMVGLIIKKQYEKALEAFDRIVAGTREIVRPGRKNERNKHSPKTVFDELQTIMNNH